MARVAVLTDRTAQDPSWKGAYIWQTIGHLAESQHEVIVFTTGDLDQIPITHPRLSVARPAPNFHVDRLKPWSQALIQFRPEVIHTFALNESAVWPSLTVWPYLDALCRVLPGVKRFSTLFEIEDFSTASSWHLGSQAWTVFSVLHAASAKALYSGRVELAPIDELKPLSSFADDAEMDRVDLLIPAPVSQWQSPLRDLQKLANKLAQNPALTVCILGGWGELPLRERRQGWGELASVAARVRMTDGASLLHFLKHAKSASQLMLETLDPESWRTLLSRQMAVQIGLEYVGDRMGPVAPMGSTANFLSRIYLS